MGGRDIRPSLAWRLVKMILILPWSTVVKKYGRNVYIFLILKQSNVDAHYFTRFHRLCRSPGHYFKIILTNSNYFSCCTLIETKTKINVVHLDDHSLANSQHDIWSKTRHFGHIKNVKWETIARLY